MPIKERHNHIKMTVMVEGKPVSEPVTIRPGISFLVSHAKPVFTVTAGYDEKRNAPHIGIESMDERPRQILVAFDNPIQGETHTIRFPASNTNFRSDFSLRECAVVYSHAGDD